ncbi:sensor histidine kinase [Chachezhania sediminis]|uniref:sensor histidine kinase n=1 Tax=Chachezhania sediminis TaxID=2599291 RepID=UPI00131C6DE1|nr:PAS domain S-box protein [Chachezhania sediminis]
MTEPAGALGWGSLSHRLGLVALGVVFVVSLTFTALFAIEVRRDALQAAAAQLELRAALTADQLSDALLGMRNEAAELAQFSPVQGIMRAASAPDRRDPVDGTDLEAWEDLLAEVFLNMLLVNPEYSQARFIGKADNWRELVRVDRRDDGIFKIPQAELQQKGGEAYLAGIESASDSYFSSITYNREHGRRDGPPTIRMVHPVRDGSGTLFGAIILNAPYESFISSALNLETRQTVIIDRFGNFFEFMGAGGQTGFKFFKDEGWRPNRLAGIAADPSNFGRPIRQGGDLAYPKPVTDLTGSLDLGMVVIPLESREAIIAPVNRMLGIGLAVSVLLSLLALIATTLICDKVTAPLRLLGQAVGEGPDALRRYKVDGGRTDEVGQLAIGFAALGQELVRQAARYDRIIDYAGQGVLTIDPGGTIRSVNRATARIFGYTKEELLNRPVTLLMDPAKARIHQRHVTTAALGIEGRRMADRREIFGLRKDGSTVPLDVSVSRAEFDGETILIGIVNDITQRKIREDERAALVEALERSNAELDQFAYVAAHDLKAPLRVINNASRWLEEDLEQHLTEDTRESLDLLKSRSARMEKLLDALLEHSRIGRTEHATNLIGGTAFVEELTELLRVPEGMSFETAGPFDRAEFQRMPLLTVLLNLVSNGFKHHDLPDGHVRLLLEDAGTNWRFTVEDNGPGIDPRYHDKVFQIFQTLRPRDEVDTSGMGLAIVQKQVKVSGGSISLSSDGRRGTAFRLSWPKCAPQRRDAA